MIRIGQGAVSRNTRSGIHVIALLVVMLCGVLESSAQLPSDCREFETPMGIDAGRASAALRAQDWRERSKAVRCLSASERAAELLAVVANDADPRVKRTALYSMGERGVFADIYARLLDDEDSLVRSVAARYAYLSGGSSVDGLRGIATDSSAAQEQRILALQSLEKLGATALPARAYLAQLLNSTERSIRIATVKALGQMGEGAQDVLPVLEARLSQTARDSREAAWLRETIVRIQPSRLGDIGNS